MKSHRGFELVECVCVYPPARNGETSISVHDDLVGVVADFPTVAEAVKWLDDQCVEADQLLTTMKGA